LTNPIIFGPSAGIQSRCIACGGFVLLNSRDGPGLAPRIIIDEIIDAPAAAWCGAS